MGSSRNSKDRSKRTSSKQKHSSRHRQPSPIKEQSEESYYSYSYSDSHSASPPPRQPQKSRKNPSSSKQSNQIQSEFAQIYSPEDYQKLLRDYRELHTANTEYTTQIDSLTTLLTQLQENQQNYLAQHNTEIQQIQAQNKALEDQISQKYKQKIQQQQAEIDELQAKNSQFDSQNSLKFSDLSLKLTQTTQKSQCEIQNLQNQISVYQLLTGVSISSNKTFQPPKITKFSGFFVFGKGGNSSDFIGKIGLNGKLAAIECVRPPKGVKNVNNFLEGVQCQVDELRFVFGQMCAEIVSAELKGKE